MKDTNELWKALQRTSDKFSKANLDFKLWLQTGGLDLIPQELRKDYEEWLASQESGQ